MKMKGYEPGRDFSAAGCDNNSIIINALNPKPETVDIHPGLVGQKAVEHLLWRMENPDPGKIRIALEPELVVPEDNGKQTSVAM